MGEESKIEWCDHTFNPWIGCAKVSPGCLNCYAESQDKFRSWTPEGWGKGKPRRRTSEANWRKPLQWNARAEKEGVRARVFCASLADWLDDEVPVEWLVDLLELIRLTPNLEWLLLTKRPENFESRMDEVRCSKRGFEETMAWEFTDTWRDGAAPENVWLGTSVEDQERADERVPLLLKIPARVHFLSCEPLLGEVDLRSTRGGTRWIGGQRGCEGMHRGDGSPGCPREPHHHHDERCGKGVDWVIVGGESGVGRREFNLQWARVLRSHCRVAGVAFFMKQMGGVRKPFAGIPEDLMVREFPVLDGPLPVHPPERECGAVHYQGGKCLGKFGHNGPHYVIVSGLLDEWFDDSVISSDSNDQTNQPGRKEAP